MLLPRFLAALVMKGSKISAPWMITPTIFLQPSFTARETRPTAYRGWFPVGNETGLWNSVGESAQQSPKYAILAFWSTGTIASPVKVNEPTTATALSATAFRAHAVAPVGVPCASQNLTLSL